jgi:hypothetical protein
MKTAVVAFWLTILAGALALPQATTTAPKKTPSKTGKTVASAGKKLTKSARKKGAPAATRQTGQMAPTPARYKEIQAALVQKGYLNGEPSGVWDADSMDAMRRYQTDQKLTPTGRVTASALIGLGLGPKPADSPATAAPPEPAARP